MANIAKPTNLNVIWASTGTKVDPGNSKTNIGWVVQLPPYEYQNWVDNRQDTAIAHFNQHGIPEWDANTEYQGNLSYTQGSNGIIYKCIRTNINLDPTNSNNSLSWVRAFEDYGSVQVVQSALTAHLNNYATLAGISNTVLARANLSVYSRSESNANYAFKGGTATIPFLVGEATQPQHAVPLAQINSLLTPATASSYGTTIYATTSETNTGEIDNKAITPLKAATIYLSKSGNLAGLTNTTTARGNLGLGSIATRNASEFLAASNNLSEVVPATARANLGLTSTATRSEDYFLRSQNNLADVSDKAAGRANLGLTALAVADPTAYMVKAENLAGLSNLATARANLGLADSVLYPSTTWLNRTSNLSDLTNTQAARNSLGLGNLATRDVFGVTGNLDLTALVSQNGYQKLPTGLIIQWGSTTAPPNGGVQVTFPIPFPNTGFIGLATFGGFGYNLNTDSILTFGFNDNTKATLTSGYFSPALVYWVAIGN